MNVHEQVNQFVKRECERWRGEEKNEWACTTGTLSAILVAALHRLPEKEREQFVTTHLSR